MCQPVQLASTVGKGSNDHGVRYRSKEGSWIVSDLDHQTQCSGMTGELNSLIRRLFCYNLSPMSISIPDHVLAHYLLPLSSHAIYQCRKMRYRCQPIAPQCAVQLQHAVCISLHICCVPQGGYQRRRRRGRRLTSAGSIRGSKHCRDAAQTDSTLCPGLLILWNSPRGLYITPENLLVALRRVVLPRVVSVRKTRCLRPCH